MASAILKGKIKVALAALFTIVDDEQLDKSAEALADAFQSYLKDDVEVLPGTFANSGGPVAGKGTLDPP